MATIKIIDPVTRIEGHMKVEVSIDGGQVVDARCSGTLFRGFETLLQGRDPWDAPVITQRICGVCPVSHGMASVKALDAAAGITPPTNATLLRNLVLGANFIQSHILHFYLLAAPDYVKMPDMTPWSQTDLWNSKLDPNVSADLLGGIEARRRAHEMGAIFGGRNPSPHAYIPGGFTSVPSLGRIDEFRTHLNWLIDFIRDSYKVDVQAVGDAYRDYYDIGEGYRRFLAYGVFDSIHPGAGKLLKSGYVDVGANENSSLLSGEITESVEYSWYSEASDLHPADGVTEPVDPLSKTGAYSWLKAPRYNGQPVEVGPLARMWVNGDYREGVSVMDRHWVRALEAEKIAVAMNGWLDELTPGEAVYDTYEIPFAGRGVGLTEAPRGALGHWVEIDEGKISHYQIITPTCWNASPRNGEDGESLGPMEKALIGTPVSDNAEPIEVLRVIHSFDPCLSCAVHIMKPDSPPKVVWTGTNAC